MTFNSMMPWTSGLRSLCPRHGCACLSATITCALEKAKVFLPDRVRGNINLKTALLAQMPTFGSCFARTFPSTSKPRLPPQSQEALLARCAAARRLAEPRCSIHRPHSSATVAPMINCPTCRASGAPENNIGQQRRWMGTGILWMDVQ